MNKRVFLFTIRATKNVVKWLGGDFPQENVGTRDGVRKVEEVIRDQLIEEKQISGKSQYVDTTAMEKNIAYPTDTNLLDQGRKRLISGFQKLKKLGRKIKVGRTFKRKAKQAILLVVKLGKGRQERIKEAASQLAGFARAVLDQVPNALRKAKKHKNERKPPEGQAHEQDNSSASIEKNQWYNCQKQPKLL